MPDTETPTPEEQPEEQQQEPDLGDAGKKAIEAEREARKAAEKSARELQRTVAALTGKVKEFEDRDKTDAEKRDARIAELEAALTERDSALEAKDREVLRRDIAKDKDVPVHLVTGTTKEEMEAAAKAALEWRGTTAKPTGFRSGASAPNGANKKEQAAAAIRSMRRGN